MKRAWVVGTVVGGTAVVAAVVVLGAWRLTRSSAPAPLAIDDVAAARPGDSSSPAGSLDGRWSVVRGSGTTAGMRILEERAATLGNNTAVGRTGAVRGSLVVDGDRVRSGSFVVDLASLEFTDDPGLPVANRSTYLRTHALETDRFPDARFVLAVPVPVPRAPGGTARGVRVRGRLTLHGVTRPITVSVDVRLDGDQVVLGTANPVPVRLADHGIEPPEIRGLSKVTGEGSFEFLVVLRRR